MARFDEAGIVIPSRTFDAGERAFRRLEPLAGHDLNVPGQTEKAPYVPSKASGASLFVECYEIVKRGAERFSVW